jgi:hypothetical protein
MLLRSVSVAEQVNISGKVVKVHKHADFCPVPNSVAEVLRLNNHTLLGTHQHVWAQGQNMKLPDGSWARIVRCKLTLCRVRIMVMLEPVERKAWESGGNNGTTVSEWARR